MEKLSFRALFFRHYDKKIADGTVTFSQIGISKNDFTRLCTEADFVPDSGTVERVCKAMKLTEEETAAMGEAASYGNDM